MITLREQVLEHKVAALTAEIARLTADLVACRKDVAILMDEQRRDVKYISLLSASLTAAREAVETSTCPHCLRAFAALARLEGK